MDNLQVWAKQELRRIRVQDIATAMTVTKSLVDYRSSRSSENASSYDSHETGDKEEAPLNLVR